jgi:hypothetical protein
MIHLYARHLASMFEQKEGVRPEVRVFGVVSVNNRVPQLFVDPFVDLAAIEPWQWPNKWIVDFLPRGSFDWRVVPWPVCSHVPHSPTRATRARVCTRCTKASSSPTRRPPTCTCRRQTQRHFEIATPTNAEEGQCAAATKPRDDDADADGD